MWLGKEEGGGGQGGDRWWSWLQFVLCRTLFLVIYNHNFVYLYSLTGQQLQYIISSILRMDSSLLLLERYVLINFLISVVM